MSLILDALKKSEAERQLGRAPGLTTPMPLRRGETEEPVRSWVRYAMWLAFVAIAIAAVWWLTRPAPPQIAVAEESLGESSRAAATATATGPDETSPPAAAIVAAAPLTSDIPARGQATDATRETTPLSAPAATSEPAAQPPPRVLEPNAPTPQDPEFESVERESEAIVAPAAPPAPSRPVLPPPPPAIEAPAPPAAAAAATAVAAEPLEQPLETLPRLDQLGGPQRDALPPLKQTMHVYAQSPAARFVLIDGHRYVEGDKLSASLQLLEIRRDGTVLQFDGLRFLLPRP